MATETNRKHSLCKEDRGIVVNTKLTGSDKCCAYDYEYECGLIYHHNYGDKTRERKHNCFWDCSNYKRGK